MSGHSHCLPSHWLPGLALDWSAWEGPGSQLTPDWPPVGSSKSTAGGWGSVGSRVTNQEQSLWHSARCPHTQRGWWTLMTPGLEQAN
jgi:hypothetical protein